MKKTEYQNPNSPETRFRIPESESRKNDSELDSGFVFLSGTEYYIALTCGVLTPAKAEFLKLKIQVRRLTPHNRLQIGEGLAPKSSES